MIINVRNNINTEYKTIEFSSSLCNGAIFESKYRKVTQNDIDIIKNITAQRNKKVGAYAA